MRASALFEMTSAKHAERVAPDLHLLARQAEEEASEAERRGEREAADDHRTRARLLLTAATTEAERIETLAERRRLEGGARGAQASAAPATPSPADEARGLAAGVAQEQARIALVRAEVDETRRARAHGAETQRLYRQASVVLRQRAALLVAAAAALGADARSVERLQVSLAAAPAHDATEAMQQADSLYADALGLLGRARAARDATTPEERASLSEAARELGFTSVRLDRGVGVELKALVEGKVVPEGKARHLAALLRAHPRGPVLIELIGPSKEHAALGVRANELRRALVTAGVPESRLRLEVRAPHSKEGMPRGAVAIWLAYGAVAMPDRGASSASTAASPRPAAPTPPANEGVDE